ncbi:MAG: hypothetical protein IJB30_06720 [Clostridia bacterium]|nr:hypothetical protein [Clostridia bacterium]MBQ4611415.1 hypothetical protein [Clostridia bacterium]
MYQESNTANVTKRSDTLLLIGLIVLIILSRSLLNFIQAAGGGILQLAVFIGLVAVCFIVFKRRFCTYRYTLFNQEPEEGDLDPYGNQKKLAMPLGTFIIEQLSGSRGGIVANIAPGDMVQLIAPGAGAIGVIGEEADEATIKNPPVYGNGKGETSHILLYRSDGKIKALAFTPSDTLISMLSEIIAAVNA